MIQKTAASSLDRQARLERALAKRTRELGCLYNLLTVFEAPDLGLAQVLQGIVDNITAGWQHRDHAWARLCLEGQEWLSRNFVQTPWRQEQPILLQGQQAGSLEVGYLAELPEADEGPFLMEERVLLEVVATRLSRFIERRRYAQEVRRQRDFAQGLVQTAQAIVLVLDQEGRIVHFNPFLEKLGGYRLPEVRGHPWDEVFLPEGLDQGLHQRFLPSGGNGQGQPCLVPIRDSRGNLLQVEWRNRTLQTKDGSPGREVLCTGQDLTQRLKLEAEHYRLAAVVEQSVDAIALTDARGVMVYANAAYEKMHDRGRAELLNRPAPMLSQARYNEALFKQMWADLDAGRAWSGHHTMRIGDGSEFEVETVLSPIRDQSGKVINYYAHHRDITQEQKLRDHLRQTQKMEAIGTLAGGIAHDFNNILGGISGYVELARMFQEDQTRAGAYLDQALKAGERAKDLVRQILTFSRQTEQSKKPLNLASEVKEALRLVRASLPATIEIIQELDEVAATVMADPTQVQQVVLNLCTNAAHAMGERGGRLEVSLKRVHIDPKDLDNYPGLGAGPHLHFCVRDNGHGMPRDVMQRIFEPFFTTKAQGEGTGLGLAVVHGIISSHQGLIKVYSQPSLGTAFHILLPCQEYDAEVIAQEALDIPRGRERLLLVDDEETLVEIQGNILSNLGYQVSAFVCSLEARKYFRADPGRFDLVLTDLTMPNLTGLELARDILTLRPSLPVILCTGLSEIGALERAKALGVREVIIKPVPRGDLARAVRRHLDELPPQTSSHQGGLS